MVNSEVIILVHGLMRSKYCFIFLERFLKAQGYQVVSYSYSSTKYKISEHVAHLKIFLQEILVKDLHTKISLITHSLGGIIAREALCQLEVSQLERCVNLIMLAPPSRGSLLAKISTNWFPYLKKMIKPLAELSSASEAYVHGVGIPKVLHLGIITGKYDLKTPPKMTRLNTPHDFIMVNSNHTFIMNHPTTKKAIINFLCYGSFLF